MIKKKGSHKDYINNSYQSTSKNLIDKQTRDFSRYFTEVPI